MIGLLLVSGGLWGNTWNIDRLADDVSPTAPEVIEAVSSLDGNWKISPLRKSNSRPMSQAATETGCWKADFDLSKWQSIEVPHYTWHSFFPQTFPDHLNPKAMYQFSGAKSTYVQGWLARDFTVPASLKGARIFLHFGSVAWESHIWVNGRAAGSHKGSFTGFKRDITDLVKYDGPNRLAVWVCNDFGESPPRHTYGKMFFASANPGGITGGVTLEALPPVNVARCLINPDIAGQQVGLAVTFRNSSGKTATCEAFAVLRGGRYPDFSDVRQYPLGKVMLKPGTETVSMSFKMIDPILWTPQNPYLYQTFIVLRDTVTGKAVCSYRDRFGFRQFHQQGDKFFLNGQRVRLYCGNIVTSGDWDRFASGSSNARNDLRRQKNQGANTIRYHMGGSDSHRMLAMADEEGLLVISEFPMFHRVFHDLAFTDRKARDEFMTNVLYEWRERLYRDYNHPSCVIWSLSNEVWTDSTVDELNEIYSALKPLDRQNRPMSADSGIHSFGIPTIPVRTDFWDAHLYNLVSKIPYTLARVDFNRYFDDLKKIYGNLNRPAAAFECLSLGHGKPSKIIPYQQELSVDDYLKLVKANQYNDVNYLGLRRFLAWEEHGGYILNDISKKAVEQFRLETRLQGFHPWWSRRDRICPSYKLITTPVFVGIELPERNRFAGRDFTFEAAIVKDRLEKYDGLNVRSELVPVAGGKAVSGKNTPVTLPENQDKTVCPVSLPIPRSVATGLYRLELTVLKDGQALCHNYYDIRVLNPDDLPPMTNRQARVALFEEKPVLRSIFTRNQFAFTPIGDFKELKNYSHLILRPTSAAEWQKIQTGGGMIREWVKKGGRLLLMEVPFTASLDWIMKGYRIDKDVDGFETTALLMEPVLRQHPLFKGMAAECFDTFNGNHGIVGDALIYPLEQNLVAAGFSCGRKGPGGMVCEAKLDQGGFIVSQVQAVTRYETDSSATRYLHNLLAYFTDRNICPAVRPLKINPDAGLNKAIKAICGGDCEPVNLRGAANRGLRDEVGGDGKGGWTDAGVNDFRQAPVGHNRFLNIPFEIIDPSTNRDRSVIILKGGKCPSFPENVTVGINKRYRRLFFLHTAWYLAAGKKIMTYTLRYKDGSTAEKPVYGGTDIGDWFAPSDKPNAPAVWEGKHPVVDLPFGFYLMVWDNPFPERTIDRLEIGSAGTSVPIVLAVSGENYVEFGATVLKKAWDFDSVKDIGKNFGIDRLKVQDGICRFTMGRPHSWLAPESGETVINGALWKRLTFKLKSSEPLGVKVLYFSPTGDNGVCDWIKPIRSVGGWDYYDVFLDQINWRHGSSPEAKQWGGRERTISLFGIDLYAKKSGVAVELGPVGLYKD